MLHSLVSGVCGLFACVCVWFVLLLGWFLGFIYF